jgi:hypothetical protein
MSTILDESKLRIADASRLMHVALSTTWRWIMKGAPSIDGQRVRLEAIRCGTVWWTSREAIDRFVERLTPKPPDETVAPPRTESMRRKASERAARKLEKIGA